MTPCARFVLRGFLSAIAAIALYSTDARADVYPIREAEFTSYIRPLALEADWDAVALALYEDYAMQAGALRAARGAFFDWSGGPLARPPYAPEYGEIVSHDHRRLDALYRAILIDLDDRLFADIGHLDGSDAEAIARALMARRRTRSVPHDVPDLHDVLTDLGIPIDDDGPLADLLRAFESELDRHLRAYEDVLNSPVVIDHHALVASGDIEGLARFYRDSMLAGGHLRHAVVAHRDRIAAALPAEARAAFLNRVNAVLYREVRGWDGLSGRLSEAVERMSPDDPRFRGLEELRSEWVVIRDEHFAHLDALYDAQFVTATIKEESELYARASMGDLRQGIPPTRRNWSEAETAFDRAEREFAQHLDAIMPPATGSANDGQQPVAIAPPADELARSYGGSYTFDLVALVDAVLGDDVSEDYAALRAQYRSEYGACLETIATEGRERRARITALQQSHEAEDEVKIRTHVRELQRISWAIDSLNRRWVSRVLAAVDPSHHAAIRASLREKKYEAYFRESPAETAFAWAGEQGIAPGAWADLHAAYSARIESLNGRMEHLLDEINTLERALEGAPPFRVDGDRLRERLQEVLLARYATERDTVHQLRAALDEDGVSPPPEIQLLVGW